MRGDGDGWGTNEKNGHEAACVGINKIKNVDIYTSAGLN
jgi:hypothetical protein